MKLKNQTEDDRFRVWKSTAVMCRVFLCSDCIIGAVRRKGGEPMDVRRSTDYTSMLTSLDTLLAANLSLLKLYYEIGRLISSRAEKGAAAAAAAN